MTTVGEMKDEMAARVRAEAERVGIEVNSLIMWPICAMDPFLEACGRLPTYVERHLPRCARSKAKIERYLESFPHDVDCTCGGGLTQCDGEDSYEV